MRLVQVVRPDGLVVAVQDGETVRDLTAVEPRLTSLRALLDEWDAWRERLPAAARSAPPIPAGACVPAPPLTPRRLFATGANYASHVREMGITPPPLPGAFFKPPGAVCADGATVELPADSVAVDYEGELAVVVGRRAERVAVADALAHVAGLTLANDISARDLPMCQTTLAKGSPGFCPLGPALVTLDALELATLSFEVRVNGELRQTGHVGDMVHGVAEIVASLSDSLPLLPGDVILTGTPAGVGIARSPPALLRPGDEVVVSSPELGVLTTRFATAREASGAI